MTQGQTAMKHAKRASGLGRAASLLAGALSAIACGRAALQHSPSEREPARASDAQTMATAQQAEPRREEPVVLVTDREALAVIEARGADLATLAFAGQAGASNAELAREPAFSALSQTLSADVEALQRRDPLSGVAVRGHAHRLFDSRWLRAATARFELVALVNRMDRHFYNPAACGELRLVYRLSYRQAVGAVELSSRLPMTLALELRADPVAQPGACSLAAQRWLVPRGLSGRALGSLLVSADGPLSAPQLTRERIVQLVSNVQTVRWPSAVRPELGGHAEYMLRAFAWQPDSQRYRVRKLENTPDVARIAREPALREKLRRWLDQPGVLAALDGGNVRLPDELLAEAVVSVTPRGLARRANRPFRSLLSPSELGQLDLTGLRFARSPEALLRRLDDLTCSGCHQSRSVAGFHLLGDEPSDALAGNALWSGTSPHTEADLARRRAYVGALALAQPADAARPLAERAGPSDDGYGAHCGLGDPGFSDWTCRAGLHCDPYEAAVGERTVGVCLPPQPSTGDPCEPARVRADVDAQRDGVAAGPRRSCDGVCEHTQVGFPGGMCASSCAALPAEAACGGIAVLTPFNDCLARARPFSECAREHVRPAGLRACNVTTPCRDDYVCARVAHEGALRGVCLPPYFVFQLRVDGHPVPSSVARVTHDK